MLSNGRFKCIDGNVGIGTTSPQNKLEVIGAVTLAGGVNASSLNVTGFSITDDSLVTLSDGSKKKIKDIRAGEEVLTLDETTGKLVPMKVNALLDHGIKPIYELTTQPYRAINTTGEHPYLVKLYNKKECDKYAGNVWNKEPDSFNGEYCTRWVQVQYLKEGSEIFVPYLNGEKQRYLSHIPQKFGIDSELDSSIEHLSVIRDKSGIGNLGAGYEDGIKAADFCLSGNFNRFAKEISIKNNVSVLLNKIRNLNSLFLFACEPCSNSCNLNNSNRRDIHNGLFIFNLSNHGLCNSVQPELLFIDGIPLSSSWRDEPLCKNSSIKSDVHTSYSLSRILRINSVESSSDILAFSIILVNSDNGKAFLCFLGSNSFIIECSSLSTFLSLSAINSDFINITANPYSHRIYKDFGASDVYTVKISSIKTLPAQHVYDLSIEGTRNFIANDIVAHNTYLATSSGNVGIGTTNPGNKLTVVGAINASGDVHFGGAIGFSPFGLSIKQGANNKVEGLALQANGALDTWAWAVLDDGDLYLTRADAASGADALADFTDIITIETSGEVGIGTTSPSSTLTVEGNLTVQGKTNSTIGNFTIGMFNSSCSGFRHGSTGGWILSCV